MADDDILLIEFLKHGATQGLSEQLLREIFTHLSNHQFLPAGEREHVRSELQRIIRNNQGD
tara:strand:- start:191 stop:373 length:183 start_codon:yes stop_codon:yes gene_type:complete